MTRTPSPVMIWALTIALLGLAPRLAHAQEEAAESEESSEEGSNSESDSAVVDDGEEDSASEAAAGARRSGIPWQALVGVFASAAAVGGFATFAYGASELNRLNVDPALVDLREELGPDAQYPCESAMAGTEAAEVCGRMDSIQALQIFGLVLGMVAPAVAVFFFIDGFRDEEEEEGSEEASARFAPFVLQGGGGLSAAGRF